MTGETVLELLNLLKTAGINLWLDGGWGVDALLGYQSRPHEDLDVVVTLNNVPRLQAVLGARGFILSTDELPVRFVMAHPDLGRIDFHTVTFDEGGGGVQPQPKGGTFRYPPEGFTLGTVLSQPVNCISAEYRCSVIEDMNPTRKIRTMCSFSTSTLASLFRLSTTDCGRAGRQTSRSRPTPRPGAAHRHDVRQ